MERMKRVSAWLLGLMLLAVCCIPAMAADQIDPNTPASLTICCTKDGVEMADVVFSVYRVAEYREGDKLVLTSKFEKFPADTQDADAENLEAFVKANSIKGDYIEKTDKDGEIYLSELKPGLYLVVGSWNDADTVLHPYAVTLPMIDAVNDRWIYDMYLPVEITEKQQETEPTDPPEDPTEPLPTQPTDPVDTNPVTKHVRVVWDDTGYEKHRPAMVKFTIYCDGKQFKYGDKTIFELKPGNDWSMTFEDLPGGHSWIINVNTVSKYNTVICLEGNTFVIKNAYANPAIPTTEPAATKPTTPGTKPTLPQSGVTVWPIGVLAAAGAACLALGGISRKKTEE